MPRDILHDRGPQEEKRHSMFRIRAVVFDLDDTLYPEWTYAFSGFNAVAAAFQARLGEAHRTVADMRRLFHTADRRRVFNVLLAERGLQIEPHLITAMIDVYRSHQPQITLHSDAEAALVRLRGRYKLGLITDGPTVSQRAKIDALALQPRFDEIIITSELGPEFAKPHPHAFERMSRQLEVEARACTYVADNPAKDFIAPNALGWATVRILRPDGVYRTVRSAPGGEAQHVIESLDQIDPILAKVRHPR